MLSMLSEAIITSWCSPLRSSPSYTASRRRFASEALAALRSKSRLYTPLAPKFLASRLLVDLYFTKPHSQRRARRTYELYCVGAGGSGWLGHGFYPLVSTRSCRAALYGMPRRRWQNSFEFYGEPMCVQASEAIEPSAASRSEQGSTPSITQKAAPHAPC